MVLAAVGVGFVFCAYWIAQVVFVYVHLRWTRMPAAAGPGDAGTGVTVVHPVKDLDFELELNLQSWLTQDYPGPVQHVFSFQAADDPAIPVVRTVLAHHPASDTVVIVNPLMPGLNGKSSNMVHGLAAAKHPIVLFGDSDTRVGPGFLLKMVRPLRDTRVGVTTCGQINIGGCDFPTRLFTFLQNCETTFNWAFLTRIGVDVGITGAAFAMRRDLLASIGGPERFGGSLLEDLFLGNLLYRDGYRLVLGPFVECHVDRCGLERSLNYARRIAIGLRRHLAVELPLFVLMLSWYWILLLTGVVLRDATLVMLGLGFMAVRVGTGLLQRPVTLNRVALVDVPMPLLFDVIGLVYLVFAIRTPVVVWRGLRYRVGAKGEIEEVVPTR